MSEQNTSFMTKLDQWSEENVIAPLSFAYADDDWKAIAAAKKSALKAIRAKVLESYRNGLAAGPRKR
jgi:hypothetical protein